MTEQEWLTCGEPQKMLEFLGGKAGDRKLRMFAIACCRAVWHYLTNKRLQNGVEQMEVFAEVAIPEDKLEALQESILAYETTVSHREPNWNDPDYLAASLVVDLVCYPPDLVADFVLAKYMFAMTSILRDKSGTVTPRRLLDDLFGNPFRPARINPKWQTPTVLALATAAYDNRTLPAGTLETVRLAILADALEEVGCDNADILNHLRQPGEHVRGCWVVDLLFDKE